jgi:hypothetical protein
MSVRKSKKKERRRKKKGRKYPNLQKTIKEAKLYYMVLGRER